MATGGGDPVSLVDIVVCDICFEVMIKPQALNCLHHFCHTCTSRLVEVRVGRGKGVECPFCKRFTPEHEIQDSFMMNNLLDIYKRKESQEIHGDHKEGKVCLQCERPGVSFYCKNCEIELCESCKDGHLRIPALKSHKVISLSDKKHDDQIIKVEKFCKLHPGNEIKYSCVPCKSAICAECKVESHDTHPTESVEIALKAIQDQARGHIKAIHQKKVKITHHLEKLNSVKADYEHEYEVNRKEIEDHKCSIVAKIEADYNELLESLKGEQMASIKNIDIDVADADNQLSTMESLLTWSGAIISTTEGSGPLCELQGGLLERLEASACNTTPVYIARTAASQFKPTRINVEDNYIGILIQPKHAEAERSDQSSLSPPVAAPQPNVKQSFQIPPPSSAASRQLTTHVRSHRETNFNLDSFKKSPLSPQFKQMTYQYKFVLKNKSCFRLCLHNNLFWVPCPKENYIDVCTIEGTLFRRIESDKLIRPRSIHALDENNMILADQNGLFVIDSEMKVNKVFDGNFLDVHVSGEKAVAFGKIDGQVHILSKSNPLCIEEPLISKTTFPLEKNPVASVMLVNDCVYVGFCKNEMDGCNDYVAKYSLIGTKLAHFGRSGSGGPGDLNGPLLCAYDQEGSVLVADWGNNRLQVLDTRGHWEVIHTLSADHRILDVVFDGDQWMYVYCYNDKYWRKIFKYKI